MPEFDDPLAALRALRDPGDGEQKPAKTPEDSQKQPPDTLPEVDPAIATGSSTMVGQMAQRTFRLPPPYLQLIRQIAKEEIMSIADAERWVVGRGLLAYYRDGERPAFEETVERRVILPGNEGD